MTRQTPEQKASKYLLDGAVAIQFASLRRVEATVQGSGLDPYKVEWNGVSWECSCPARINRCAHVLAVKKVVGDRQAVVHIDSSPSPVDALFEG